MTSESIEELVSQIRRAQLLNLEMPPVADEPEALASMPDEPCMDCQNDKGEFEDLRADISGFVFGSSKRSLNEYENDLTNLLIGANLGNRSEAAMPLVNIGDAYVKQLKAIKGGK
jgi:hypothetical protein